MRSQKKRTILYLYIILALLVLLVAATYTWFSLSKTPRVSDMRVSVAADVGIELAARYDAEDDEWGQVLRFADLVSESAPLRPVTWSQANGRFYSADYGFDGRMTGRWEPLSDERNANRRDRDGHYIISTFYARADKACSVRLMDAVALNEGAEGAGTYVIGTPVWNSETVLHEDKGFGAETAVRLGFKITPIDAVTGRETGAATFYVYEPNADRHIDGGVGYVATESIDPAAQLVSDERLIVQTASSWSEAYPVQREVTIKEFGQFLSNPVLFSLEANAKVKIELYIWLEGQDIDCSNLLESAQLLANVQFNADFGSQSGIVDIPDR